MLIGRRLLGAVQGTSGRGVGVRRGWDGRGLAGCVWVWLLDVRVAGEASPRLRRTRGRGRPRSGVVVVRGAGGIEVRRLLLRRPLLRTTRAKVLPLIVARRTGARVRAFLIRRELSLWGHPWMAPNHVSSTHATHHVHSAWHATHGVHGPMGWPSGTPSTW